MQADGNDATSDREEREPRPPKYQVGLSYATADREYVQQVAAELQKQRVMFFDPTNDVSLVGRYEPAAIQEIYDSEIQHVLIFISAEYVKDAELRHERQAAVDRALRIDDSQVPGLTRIRE